MVAIQASQEGCGSEGEGHEGERPKGKSTGDARPEAASETGEGE
jgi:hypothetical protein